MKHREPINAVKPCVETVTFAAEFGNMLVVADGHVGGRRERSAAEGPVADSGGTRRCQLRPCRWVAGAAVPCAAGGGAAGDPEDPGRKRYGRCPAGTLVSCPAVDSWCRMFSLSDAQSTRWCPHSVLFLAEPCSLSACALLDSICILLCHLIGHIEQIG